VKETLSQAAIDFLSFSNKKPDPTNRFGQFSQRDWKRGLSWLDDTGLSFYFLDKLKRTEIADEVPAWVVTRIERNLMANQQRVAHMAGRFQKLNRGFDDAGVNYAAVKGLSLVPQFCPDAALRPLADLDYLVDNDSLCMAQRVVEENGYTLTARTPTEFKFLNFTTGRPPRNDEQYSHLAPHAVELHPSLWDGDVYGVFMEEAQFSLATVRTRVLEGFAFRALPEEDVFLLQSIHAFQHILLYWIRMSWLYEIGYFLKQRTSDTLFWSRVENRIGGDPVLRHVVVLITELAALFFSAPVPSTIAEWSRELPFEIRVWIENYARTWAFGCNTVDDFSFFPTAKLVIFLHQQYVSDTKGFVRKRLLPSTRLARSAHELKTKPRSILDANWRKRQRVVQRTFFHLAAGLRYLCDIPRWLWLNRASSRSASLHM
jgi:hypothetical protein